jgi:hypothetical protein
LAAADPRKADAATLKIRELAAAQGLTESIQVVTRKVAELVEHFR